MQEALAFNDDIASRAISPFREMGAYEALWLKKGTTFNRLAKMFGERPASVPSDFIENIEEAYSFAEEVVNRLERSGVFRFGVTVHGAGEYPANLRDATNPVELLYFQGWWDLVHSRSVAIVGTREPSSLGIARAKKLSRLLVEHDFTVVSGLARGIDTVAHTTALERGGRTIAVIGTPLSEAYPKENGELQKRIAEDFLLVSQIPVIRYSNQNFRVNRFFFPERNKTMSALTEATVIVEAGETSGTLVQARAALAQKRKLFILNNCFENPKLSWPRVLESKGAIRIRDFDDILDNLTRPDNEALKD